MCSSVNMRSRRDMEAGEAADDSDTEEVPLLHRNVGVEWRNEE